jgi:hypothetical protein
MTKLFFCLNLLVALGLILLVIGSPWLDNSISSRPLGLFAHDKTLRRTAVASAVGLLVTAYVFFWPALARRARSRRQQTPPPIAGA